MQWGEWANQRHHCLLTCQSQPTCRVKVNNLRTRLIPALLILFRIFHHLHSVYIVTFTTSIQPHLSLSYIHLPLASSSLFRPYALVHSFHVSKQSQHLDQLYSLTNCQFQPFFASVHSSVYVDYNYK